jgi:hypothetical protein
MRRIRRSEGVDIRVFGPEKVRSARVLRVAMCP